ncbi:MAG: AAA family ATPase [Kofleriaceae bacterium]|nr:AAA family ATPase [Kofleriaceae bacterium]
MPRSSPVRSPSELWSAPVFPRPVATFAGRRAELERVLAHVDRDTLFFLFGVGGIGKSELAYQIVHEVRLRPRWAEAVPVLVELRPGATASRTLAQLLAAVGAVPAPRRGQPTEEAHLGEQLELLARALEARPYLLVLDDAHHLPPAAVAEALGYLSRRVQASRLLVASRREIVLAPDAPPPVVTTLGPLDAAATAEMVAALAERLAVAPPEPERVLRATRGSPFHIHRLLARDAPDAGSLEASLAELAPAARHLLAVVAVADHRPSRSTLARVLAAAPGDDDAAASGAAADLDGHVRELAARFLVDASGDRLVTHDLVREPLLAALTADELAAAHRDAARAGLAELEQAGGPLLLAVDALHHELAAGRPAAAWAVIERWQPALAAAGNEHLLVAPLERLRELLPAHAVAIELLLVRLLLRASSFEAAGRALARVGEVASDELAVRHGVLAGEIAQRAGEHARAEALFTGAVARAPDPDSRFQARLRAAIARVFADDGERARAEVAAALAELPAPTPRQEARAAWARTVSWMFDERHERAALEARQARAALPATGTGDLVNQLAMLETLAAVESEDMEHARAAARLIDEGGLRQRVASLYRAIVRHADGEAAAAGDELVALHADLRGHGDTVNAFLAAFHGSAALADVGKLSEAQRLAAEATALAQAAGWRGPTARALAHQAFLAAEAMQGGLAHRLADLALAGGHLGPRTRAKAHCAHARAHTVEGDTALALDQLALARAAVADPELAVLRSIIDVEQTAVDLVAGNFDRAIEHAERALDAYRGRSRRYEATRARLVLAAAHLARARRTDLLLAERALARVREEADRAQLRSIQVGAAILAAALARREQRDRAAREVLAAALRELDPERGSLYAGVLLAAIDGGAAARAVPGVVALLGHLGFSEAVDHYLVDRQGRRAATDREVARERTARELFVDAHDEVIVARAGAVELRGKPMLCTLLAALVAARGETVPPDALYTQVWGVAEYHPLQHRNALYVAINRLRACLREALPERDRDVIERVGGGWRLADDVDACVAISARPKTK